MRYQEKATLIDCLGEKMVAIAAEPELPRHRGVLIVVGGPQYRAGSHRQFTLLARSLASGGYPVLRFDYRGMGDSEGTLRTFEDIGHDIRAAIDALYRDFPALQEIVIWGLCDAASAALFYAHGDGRVGGLVLANPWVRTASGEASAYVRHYYANRLLQPEFWKKLVSGKFRVAQSLLSFTRYLRDSLNKPAERSVAGSQRNSDSLPERMAAGLEKFRGPVLFVLSGNDLTAKEFEDVADASRQWKKLMSGSQIKLHRMPTANHTFARAEWRSEVETVTEKWLGEW